MNPPSENAQLRGRNESPLRQLRWLLPPLTRGARLRRGPQAGSPRRDGGAALLHPRAPVLRQPPLPKGGGPAQPVEGFLPPSPPKPQGGGPPTGGGGIPAPQLRPSPRLSGVDNLRAVGLGEFGQGVQQGGGQLAAVHIQVHREAGVGGFAGSPGQAVDEGGRGGPWLGKISCPAMPALIPPTEVCSPMPPASRLMACMAA